MGYAVESTPSKPRSGPMNKKGWIGITGAALASVVVTYWVNREHPNWGTEDFSRIAGMWLVLFAALAAAWVSYVNAERQGDLQKEITKLNNSLALNLEEAKVQIANRYQAQVALNQAAMTAADRIHELQKGAPTLSEAQKLLDRIREASEAMQTSRGALLMVPKEYREAWEKLQQQVVYVEERTALEIKKEPLPDLRSFYKLPDIGVEFGTHWEKFNEVASVKTKPPP
jgi:hypothetical protein